MCRLNFLQLSNDSLSVLHADGCGVDLLAFGAVSLHSLSLVPLQRTLALEESLQVASDPSFATPDQENGFGCHCECIVGLENDC